MWSNNKKVDALVNILIFLVTINFFHYGQFILPVICLILFIDKKFKFKVNNIKLFVLLCLFFPANLFSLVFVTDPVLIEAGASYIFIIGIFEIFMTFENVLTGVFTGLGKTFPVMCLTTPITIGRIPLAWYMAFKLNMGIEGVWWAISITTMLKGLGLMLLYKYYSKKF